MQRRRFLCHTGALAGAALFGQLGMVASRAASTDGYKALVCIFLAGGNDSNNMVVPIDTAGYANYAKLRTNLALPQSQLLPLQEGAGILRYGFHPALSELQGLWTSGETAIMANVGPLVRPLTKAQYALATSPKPATLFSHLDQQHEWQAGISDTPSRTGWGGRLSDQLAALNASASIPAMISASGNNLFVTGTASEALVIPVYGSFGLGGFSNSTADASRLSGLKSLLGVDLTTNLTAASQNVMSNALQSAAALNPVLTNANTSVASYFSGLTSNFAGQLLAIAKIIEARASLGAQRQVFLATLGGFDTHTAELATHQSLYAQLDAGLGAFHSAMSDIGAGSNVTSFTLSEFSRTFQANTEGGSDHAWGSHHLVVGGAVKGGKVYGTMPTLALGGPDDVGQGRWIPSTAVDQYAATLASWFGADAAALTTVLPNLSAFSPNSLGFV